MGRTIPFLPIELHQKWKDGNGTRLENCYINKTEKNLMKCSPSHLYTVAGSYS